LPAATRSAYTRLLHWREERARSEQVPDTSVATDRALFTYVCTGRLDTAGLHDVTGIPAAPDN
jgi:hypothetical protein